MLLYLYLILKRALTAGGPVGADPRLCRGVRPQDQGRPPSTGKDARGEQQDHRARAYTLSLLSLACEKGAEVSVCNVAQMREIGELEGAYQSAMADVEALGSQGKVDESMAQLTKAEALKAEKQDKERELQQLTETSGASGTQKLRVCDICGAYLSILDSDRRLADHFGGKVRSRRLSGWQVSLTAPSRRCIWDTCSSANSWTIGTHAAPCPSPPPHLALLRHQE